MPCSARLCLTLLPYALGSKVSSRVESKTLLPYV